MTFAGELIIGAVIVIGLLGIVFPILPGSLLIVVAIGIWAAGVGGAAWGVFAAATAVILAGEIVKYFLAGRCLKSAGIPNITIAVGGVLGIIGFFVIPVIGLFIGFIVGAFGAELVRTHSGGSAWRGAISASKAAVITMGIELFAALIASGIWLAGAVSW